MSAVERYNPANNLDDLQRTAKMLAVSGYFSATGAVEVQIAQLATKIMAGAEFGFGPFAAVNGIYIVQGRPSIGANLMASAVKASARYDYRVRENSDKVCRIEFFERVNGKLESLGVSEFTAADAAKAGTKNMDKYPKNMLFARAMSNGVRFYVPDVFNGNSVYVPEELGANVDGDGNVIDVGPQIRAVDATTGEIEYKQAAPTTQPTVDGDVLFMPDDAGAGAPGARTDGVRPPAPRGTITEATLKRLHALGNEVYGKQWDAKRPALVQHVTTGAATSAADLLEEEARKLCAGMDAKLAKMRQPDAQPQAA